ncbi:MAG: trypsin-like peptidase domain-containing protein [Streptosporangiaceae bacterium]
MTSIRVSTQGHTYVFPAGATVRIGTSPDSDVVLNTPTAGAHHARLVSHEDAWQLVDDEVTGGIWSDGWVTSLLVTSRVTALLGNEEGATEVRFTPFSEAIAVATGPTTVAAGNLAQQLATAQTEVVGRGGPPGSEQERIAAARTEVLGHGGPPPPAVPAQAGAAPPVFPQAMQAPTIMASDGPPGSAGGPGQPPAPVLVTRLGREQRIFPVGTRVRVGRDPSLELVSMNPLVSRETHGVITSDQDGATYTDQSRRGSFLNGKQLHGPLRITESVILRLGDPATGEELGITPPLSSARLARNRDRRVLSMRMRMIAVAAAIVVIAGVVVGVLATNSGTPAPAASASTGALGGGLQASVLQHAETATVRLLIGSPSNYTGWGSGTIVSPNGLILTNAHVAEPQATGAAVAMGLPSTQLGPDPSYLTVELVTGQSSPVKPTYRARPVDVDGYLDFAVVQIYATSSGQPVNPASLHLPYLTVGSDSAIQLDQTVTVLGFPGVSDSDTITVTTGVISTFVPDPLDHVKDTRFELETTARVAHGNSGGAAINDAGQLIGVPSLTITGEGNDISWRLRSVSLAVPLITAARDHTTYHSRILVPLTGQEQVTGAGIGTGPDAACAGGRSIPDGSSAIFGVDYGRLPMGLDTALLIEMPGGDVVTDETGGLPQSTATQTSGCLSYELDASDLGLSVLPAGSYQLQLLGGPQLTALGPPASLTVGSGAAAQPSSTSS